MRKRADLPTLRERREKSCVKFAMKNVNNPQCRDWFVERPIPEYERRAGTHYNKYIEPTAWTDRDRNSAKNNLIRLLNKKLLSVNISLTRKFTRLRQVFFFLLTNPSYLVTLTACPLLEETDSNRSDCQLSRFGPTACRRIAVIDRNFQEIRMKKYPF